MFDNIASEFIDGNPTKEALADGIDINTVLRQAEEQINQLIEQNKSK